MKITEQALKKLISNTIKECLKEQTLNEAFENPELRELVSKHGGINKKRSYYLNGGRLQNDGIKPFDKATIKKELPKEAIDTFMEYFFPTLKLNTPYNSVLVFNDGCGVIVEFDSKDMYDFDKQREDRNKKYAESDNDEYSSKYDTTYNKARGLRHYEQNPEHNSFDL